MFALDETCKMLAPIVTALDPSTNSKTIEFVLLSTCLTTYLVSIGSDTISNESPTFNPTVSGNSANVSE